MSNQSSLMLFEYPRKGMISCLKEPISIGLAMFSMFFSEDKTKEGNYLKTAFQASFVGACLQQFMLALAISRPFMELIF
jgi:hypothetical protein